MCGSEAHMKRMLYACTQMPWPLDNGQKIVSFSDLNCLSKSFQIDVVSYIDPINFPKKDEYCRNLGEKLPGVNFFDPVEHQVLRGNLKGKMVTFVTGVINQLPYVVSKYRSAKYMRKIEDAVSSQTYDVLYIDHLAPSYVLSSLSRATLRDMVIVYRAHDIFSETLAGYSKALGTTPISLATRVDLRICQLYERRLWINVDAILPVTRRLEQLIVKEIPALKPKITYFPVVIEPVGYPLKVHSGTQRVLYIGTVHYPPNLLGLKWFLEKCWHLVLAEHPNATLDIVGRGGDQLLPVPDSVRIHNYVDDLSTFYQSADVFIVPLFAGSGVRLKILNALNHGLPVVSTHAGYAGLEVEEGKHILVADDPQSFANHICDLLGSREKREQLALNGREFIETNHSLKFADQAIGSMLALLGMER